MKRRIVWLKEERRKRRATARKSRATARVAPTSRYARVGLAPALSTLWRLMHTHIDGVRTYWRGMKLLVTSAPLFATASLVLLGLFSIVPVMQVWLMQQLIDLLSAPLHLAGRHAGTLDGTVLILFAVLYLFTLVLPESLQPVQTSLDVAIQERVTAEIDRRVMQAAARLVDLGRIEAPFFHDQVKLIRQYIHEAPLFPVMSSGLGRMFTLGGLLLLLVHIHPVLPLVLLLVGAPYLRARQRMEGEKYRSMTDHTRVAREMEYYTRLALEPTVAHEVRIFGLGDFLLQRFRTRRDKAMAEVQRLRLRELVQTLAFSGITTLVLAGAFLYTVFQTGAGHLQIGDIALYFGAVWQAQEAVIGLGGWFGQISGMQLQLRSLFDFLDDAQPAIALLPEGQGALAPARFKEGIELREVSFHYPGGSQDMAVLQGVNARLPAGKVTVLVGINGAGKSTLVKLLTRMYDPTSGQILLDSASLATYELGSLRKNIAVGDRETEPDMQRIEQAAHWSGADEIASKLPEGYATELTCRFEGGMELSGGEWQKVALARSFLRDAALVILDEPASALDAEAEHQLFQHFRELIAGKTALLISHRLSTVRMADQILVLDGGRIVEAGSHAELMARGGHYASLYEMQAGRYH